MKRTDAGGGIESHYMVVEKKQPAVGVLLPPLPDTRCAAPGPGEEDSAETRKRMKMSQRK